LSRFEVIGSNLVGRGYVDNNDNESDKLKWRGEWEHTRFLTTLTVNYNYNYYSFEQYLKAQKKRNANQILYYARRYHQVLETGDASSLATLQSGAITWKH
jgi:hypothetical protein